MLEILKNKKTNLTSHITVRLENSKTTSQQQLYSLTVSYDGRMVGCNKLNMFILFIKEEPRASKLSRYEDQNFLSFHIEGHLVIFLKISFKGKVVMIYG